MIPAPYWVSYTDMVLLGNGEPVVINTGIADGFKITPKQLEASITPNTKLVVLNSPSNPTGVMYTKDELKALGEVMLQHPDLIVVTDDIYEHILLTEQPFVNILNACPELYERCVVLNGVSKAYSMTGWRIGYAAGPDWLIQAMKKIQSQSTSNPTSISQIAAMEALNGDQSCIAPMVNAFRERHEFVVQTLNKVNGISCLASQGAFYSFPNCEEAIQSLDGVEDDVEFAEYMITNIGVAMVPGSAFGAPGYMRLSFATSMENLKEALSRVDKLLS